MGCTCNLHCGQIPEADANHVILKITEEKESSELILEQLADEKQIPQNLEEITPQKPLHLSRNYSDSKICSPEISRLELTMSCRQNEEIIQEGEVNKYRPGFKNQYISRWCVLTTEYFMYYKNRGSAQVWIQTPLFFVPISEIKTVNKVNFKISGVDEKCQFEIFLKSEDKAVEVSRETDKTPIMKSLITKTKATEEKNCVVKGMLMKRPLRPLTQEDCDNPFNAERVSWSVREVEWFSSEKRLLFIAGSSLERDLWVYNLLRACGID